MLTSWQRDRAEIISRAIKEKNNQTVSVGDIACGEGSILKYIGERNDTSGLYGYDVSQYALNAAKELGINTQLFDINIWADFDKLEVVDYYLMLEILEHIGESERALAKILEKTNKGVFFSFPNSGYFPFRLRLLFGKFPKQWNMFPNEHLRYWTYADLKWWLKAQGFTNYTIHTYRGIPFLSNIWPSVFAAAFVIELDK